MPTLDNAPRDIVDFVNEVVEKYHGKLLKAGVTFSVLIASPTEKELEKRQPPFLKLHGYAAYAIASITPLEQRIKGVPDVTIKIDKTSWDRNDVAWREGLIDHEAMHFSLGLDQYGQQKEDKCGRPVVKMRLHDVELGVFDLIVERHGLKAPDGKHVQRLMGRYRQRTLDWGDDMAPQTDGENCAPEGEEIAEAISR